MSLSRRAPSTTSPRLLVIAIGVSAIGCTEYHPRPAAVPPKKMEVLRAQPPGVHVKASLEAKAATPQKARDRLIHDAEKEGCDALVVTSEDADTFEFHGDQVERQIMRADCVVRDATR